MLSSFYMLYCFSTWYVRLLLVINKKNKTFELHDNAQRENKNTSRSQGPGVVRVSTCDSQITKSIGRSATLEARPMEDLAPLMA